MTWAETNSGILNWLGHPGIPVKTIFYNKTHKWKKNPTQESNQMAAINASNFPRTTTNTTTTQKSLSIVTVESPFARRITTKQPHFDNSLFFKANCKKPTWPHNLPNLAPQTLQLSCSYDFLTRQRVDFLFWVGRGVWVITGSCGTGGVGGGLKSQSWHRLKNNLHWQNTPYKLFTERWIRHVVAGRHIS